MTGYRLTQADRARIDPKNLCPKCDHLLRVPAQTITCGHRYCKECIDSVLRQENSKCLVDGAVLKKEEVFPDKFVEREILSFVLNCVYHDKGCHWKGELRHREAHEPSCEFGEVPCVHPECGIMIQRSELANHLQNICNYRAEACSFCQTMIVVATMTQHYQTCPSYPESCSECGQKDIPRCKMSLHLDPTVGDCEEVKALCPFEEIGCKETKVMVLKERENHLKEEAPRHLGLLLNHVKETSLINSTLQQTAVNNANGSLIPLKQQVEKAIKQIGASFAETKSLTSKIGEHDSRIKVLESSKGQVLVQSKEIVPTGAKSEQRREMQELSRRVHNQEAKTTDLEVFMVEGNRTYEDLERQVTALKREQDHLKEIVRKIQRQNESLEHTLGVRNMALADLEEYIQQQEVSSNDGSLVWKISDFARRKQDALTGKQVSIYSPCFYTSRYGYKMCARVYLNGDGMGKGTHISVFFVVMRGQYDGLLRWPFRQKVTMMLLDQDNVEHVIDAFRPDPSSSSFQKPRRDMNVASGCPTFCPLSELNTHAYVRDDTMFLKIIVDTSDL